MLKDLGIPPELRDDLRHAEEVVARVKIREENELEGLSLRDLELPARTGMWVIAIRRDLDWVYGPGGDEQLREGDVLFLQGPGEGVDRVRELAGGTPHQLPPPVVGKKLSNLDRAVDLVIELKNASEVAVGLAYSAILLRDRRSRSRSASSRTSPTTSTTASRAGCYGRPPRPRTRSSYAG